ncbi:hypothetical protein Zmor_006065 [Zophobas morio]|uniref:Uncharacterized protein n=1 Tax=Zophobas morio TaxID=2755281 RepID=A0AA38IP74_9CUCU|nr:hypothetical protein Zmor_006065 [Zophobas morio]
MNLQKKGTTHLLLVLSPWATTHTLPSGAPARAQEDSLVLSLQNHSSSIYGKLSIMVSPVSRRNSRLGHFPKRGMSKL